MFRALGVTKEGFGLLKQDVVSEAARAAQTTCLLFTGVRILQVNRPKTRAESGTTPARDFRLVMCMCDAQLPERKKGATATGYNSTDALRRAVQKHFCAAGGLHNAYLYLDENVRNPPPTHTPPPPHTHTHTSPSPLLSPGRRRSRPLMSRQHGRACTAAT